MNVICPCASEEILQCPVVGWEFIFSQNVIRDNASLAELHLFIQRGLERISMGCLVVVLGRLLLVSAHSFIFGGFDSQPQLLSLCFLQVDRIELWALVAFPFVPYGPSLALEDCTIIPQARDRASPFSVPIELCPDGVKGGGFEHEELLVTAVFPCHAAQDSRMEIDAHANSTVQEVGREGRVGGEGHDGCVVVARVGVGSPSLGKRVLLGQQEWPHISEHENVHVEVGASVNMENNESDSVRDGNGQESHLLLG